PGGVDDHAGADGVACDGGTATSGDDGHTVFGTGQDGCHTVLDRLGDDDRERHVAVVGGVGGVEGEGARGAGHGTSDPGRDVTTQVGDVGTSVAAVRVGHDAQRGVRRRAAATVPRPWWRALCTLWPRQFRREASMARTRSPSRSMSRFHTMSPPSPRSRTYSPLVASTSGLS